MKEFDLVLVLGYFRSAAPYLAIIRHLSAELRIGLISATVDPKYLGKTRRAQTIFLELCQQLGAEIVREGEPLTTRLLVVQQFPYPPDTAATICSTIHADRTIGLLSLALAGIPLQDNFLRQFGVEKVFVLNERLFRFLLGRREAQEVYAGIDVEQVGLPYAKYPVFPDFAADYVIAAPTGFSFRKEVHKHQFFSDVLRLLSSIPGHERVVYKAHNGTSRDYFTPRAYALPGALLARVPGARRLLEAMVRFSPSYLRLRLERLLTSVLHALVMQRAIPMSALTPYADVSLEAFLPGVTRGVIGGLSNTIWGTLFFGLPFYNCADEEERSKTVTNELLPHKDSSNYLDLNLQFFRVPYCQGEISRGARGEEIVMESDREGDLVAAIRTAVAGAPTGS